jgi:hypothetical protein
MSGDPGVLCSHLNFGSTPYLWIGSEGGDGGVESLYAARFNVDALATLPNIGAVVVGAEIVFTANSLESQDANTMVYAQMQSVGNTGMWVEGDLDGGEATEGSQISTYKYQYATGTLWPNSSPHPAVNVPLGSVDVSGVVGVHEWSIDLELDTVLGWIEGGAATTIGNGILLTSNAAPLDLILSSKEDDVLTLPSLRVDVCYP